MAHSIDIIKRNWTQLIVIALVLIQFGRAEQHRHGMQRDIDRLYDAVLPGNVIQAAGEASDTSCTYPEVSIGSPFPINRIVYVLAANHPRASGRRNEHGPRGSDAWP